MKIEVSNGEIVDKLTIIQIKLDRISEEEKLINLRKEKKILDDAVEKIMSKDDILVKKLYEVNTRLWDIEDRIREMEKSKDFGQEFIDTARAVYFSNDERAGLKKQINLQTGSDLIEEKSYEDYS